MDGPRMNARQPSVTPTEGGEVDAGPRILPFGDVLNGRHSAAGDRAMAPGSNRKILVPSLPPFPSWLYGFFSRPGLAIGLPFTFLCAATLWLNLTDWDVRIVERFYNHATHKWTFLDQQPWIAIYLFGTWPGWSLGFAGLLVWLVRYSRRDQIATLGMFCAVVLILGPGLFVNTVLKPHFHRPRPNQLFQFGGDHAFTPVLVASGTGETRSFPSGHASMGFYLMTPAFVFLRRRPHVGWMFIALGMTCGLILGITRVVQGRHFPSDVIWAWAVVYFTALSLYYGLGLPHRDTLGESRTQVPSLDHPTQMRQWAARRSATRHRKPSKKSNWRSAA